MAPAAPQDPAPATDAVATDRSTGQARPKPGATAGAADAAKPGLSPRKTDRERDDRATDRGAKRGEDGRKAGKLTLSDAISDEGGRQRSLAAIKRKQDKARAKALGLGMKAEKQVRDVQLPETIVVSELANRMAERGADVVKA